MFDVGFWEFALIGVIALIIVGPERMPGIARTAGKYAGKAKRFIAKIQDDVSEELEVDKLKEQLKADGIPYQEVDRSTVEHFPYDTVPQLWLDWKHVGGYSEYMQAKHAITTESTECEACQG